MNKKEQLLEKLKKVRELKKVYGEQLHQAKVQEEAAESPWTAAMYSAASGATFGASDLIATKLGWISPEELDALDTANPIASAMGEGVGTVAGLIGTGGAGAAAKVGSIAAKQAAKHGGKLMAKKLAKGAAEAGVEGAVYGAGRAVSDSAKKNRELTVESLISEAGLHGVLGAATGGIFSAAGQGLKKAGSKIKELKQYTNPIIQNAKDKLFSPGQAAVKYLNIKPTTLQKNGLNEKDIIDVFTKKADDGSFLLESKFQNSKSLKQNILNRVKELDSEIDSTYKKFSKEAYDDLELGEAEAFLESKVDIDSVIRRSREELLNPEKAPINIEKFQKKFDKIADNVRKQFLDTDGLNAKKIHSIRRRLDQEIKYAKKPGQYTEKENIYYALRKNLNDEIFKYLDSAESILGKKDPNLLGTVSNLKALNKEYQVLSLLGKQVDQKIDREFSKGIFDIGRLSDMYIYMPGMYIDPATMIGVGATKKYLESDFRRKTQILNYLKKSQRKTDEKINSSISNFFKVKKPKIHAPKEAKGVFSRNLGIQLLNAGFGGDIDDKEGIEQEIGKIKDKASYFASNPVALQENLNQALGDIEMMDPDMYHSLAGSVQSAVNYINSLIPERPVNPLTPSRPRFTKSEIAYITDSIKAVQDPRTLLDELNNGYVSAATTDAVRNVYPALYDRIQNDVRKKLVEEASNIDYSKRLYLSFLFNVSVDASTSPEVLSYLQSPQVLSPTPQGPDMGPPGRPGRFNINPQEMQTDIDRITYS